MPKQLFWSPLAEQDLELILAYIDKEWGSGVTNRFISKLDKATDQISVFPKLFPLINRKRKVRKCVITKQNSLFYREHRNKIEILRFFDTRQDPEILNF